MNWTRLTINMIVFIAAYVSIIGLYLVFWPIDNPRPSWHVILWVIATIIYFTLMIIEAWRISREAHRSFSSDKKIKKYMRKWVSNRGRTLILSRDLSWADDFEVSSTLLTKARAHELIIYMQHQTEFSKKLASAGAEVKYYGESGFSPLSRFTIVGSGKEGSRIAVGTERKGKHLVYEYDRGEHPIMALSEDVIRLLKACSK